MHRPESLFISIVINIFIQNAWGKKAHSKASPLKPVGVEQKPKVSLNITIDFM